MKALKIISYIIIALIGVFLIVPLFLPDEMYFEESAQLNVDPVAAFHQVNNLHNWEDWSPWLEMDPKTELSYSDTEEGEGAAYSWDGPVSGSGTLTILETDPYRSVHFLLEFEDRGTSEGGFRFEPTDEGTRLTWYMQMDSLNYPVGRWLGAMMPSMLKEDFRKGLVNIEKSLVE